MDVGNLISVSSAFSKTSLNIWKFMVHVLLKPELKNFPQFIVIHTVKGFGIVNKAEIDFSKFAGILSTALSQHHFLGFEIAPLEFSHLH